MNDNKICCDNQDVDVRTQAGFSSQVKNFGVYNEKRVRQDGASLESLIRSRPMRLRFSATKFYLKVEINIAAHPPFTNY